jgi:hypothetical protein
MNRMDDLLRDTLRGRAADSTAGCVDVETAAAFVDGTLPARARSSAETHIADCPRCLAVLAALVRSTPPPTPRTWWRRPALAWFVPAAVAAGAVAIWINVPDSRSAPPVHTMSGEAAPLESSRIPAVVGPPLQPQIPSATTSRREAAEAVRVRETAEPSAKVRSVPSRSDAASENKDLRQVDASFSAAPARPAAAAPVVRPDAAGADAATSAAQSVETVTVSGAAPIVDTMSVATFRTSLLPIIVSPNRVSQWRVGITGEVEHSADGGKTWQSQEIGAKATPAAGSSPSPSVCWLVGRGGLVLITTDGGQSWRRLPFPAAVDLASVRATDDQTATIVSVDGRTFTTSDGGSNWK